MSKTKQKRRDDEIQRFYVPEIEDLKRKFILHPLTQHKVKFSASEASASVELGWRRGKQAGIHEAYLTLREKFPKAAKYLLSKHKIDTEGTIKL